MLQVLLLACLSLLRATFMLHDMHAWDWIFCIR